MELPERFKGYNNLINIIRKLVDPNYLTTKEECLKWFVHYEHDQLMYQSNQPSSKELEEYLEINRSLPRRDAEHFYYYDIKSCKLVYFNNVSSEIISETELTEQYICECLNESQNMGIILKATLNPKDERVKRFIETSLGRKIYPLDKNRLFEMLSLGQLRGFENLFANNIFIKHTNNDYITIKNNCNNSEIKLSKTIFNCYCHFNDIIDLCEENVNIIITPFSFSDAAARHFTLCLTESKFIMPGYEIENTEYGEFKQLMVYFQVILA